MSPPLGNGGALALSLTAHAGDIVGRSGRTAPESPRWSASATLVAPSDGEVRYGDRSAGELGGALRQRIGLLAHELLLYPELSPRQNLTFFADLYGLDSRRVVPEAIERAGLAERADDPVAGFSRGMRPRLALERAPLHGPRLALFHEPFTGPDDHAVGVVTARIRRLAADGAIVLMATHDLDLAEGLVTRVALIRNGRLASDERAEGGLRARYRDLVGR
jgi:heme exporter protein A